MHRIVTILPKGEGFSAERFGAIALCVRDFTHASRYRGDTLVIGGDPPPGFAGLHYASPPRARLWQNRTRAYANGAAALVSGSHAELAEIHNRPILANLIGANVSCRLALHLHNDPQEMEGTRRPRERLKLLKRLSGVYCVSRYIRERFAEGLPAEAEAKLFVIHNGIALPQTLPPKENTLLFAGRLTEGKGALLLAQALRLALPTLESWRAMFIGARRHEAGRAPTPHEKEIAETLQALGPQVEMAGFLPHEETLGAFARAAIAVVPSLWAEPFGRTALEAMAYGCAVISSGTGGLPEVTRDAALIPEALTPEAFAAAIVTLANDAGKRAALQQASRARAMQFAIETCTKTLDTARIRILSGGPYGAG